MRSSRWVSVLALVGLLDVRAWGQSVPLGTEFQVNEFWTAPQFAASVAVDGAGNFVVVWQDERYYSPVPTSLQTRGISTRDIFGRRFDSLGTALSSDFRVTDPNDPNFPNPRRPVVARSFSGDFVVAWESPGPPYGYGAAIAARPFNSVGDALGAAFQVNTNSARRIELPDMAMDSAGNFVVVWERYDRILQAQGRGDLTIANVAAQRFNALAAPVSGEFQVDPDPNSPSDPNQPDSDQPSVAMNKTTGEFVVVWHHTEYLDGSSSSIRAQRFDNTGGRLSSDFQVNTVTQYDQYVPSVSTNAAGDFMVVWTDSSAANSNVAARVFDSQGNGLTTDIPVNIVTALDQGIPDVSGGDAASGNRFVVTWQSYTQLAPDSSRHGVFARSFSSAGVPLEPEFLVNTYTTENQFDAAVAMQTAGDFVVVWTSDCPGGRGAYGCTSQDGDRAGVFAQRRGDPTPTATPTATPTPTNTATPTITATPGPLCSRTDSCFFFELRSADFSNPITAVFTWRLTNNCAEPLTRVDWRFVPGAMVTDPLEGGTYNSGTHTYLVDVVGGPHAGVGFTPSDGDPLTTGEFDDFTFTVARAGLSSTTVLWNNATSGSSTGRIDMMSTLCYQLPQQAAIVDASACFEESEGSWRVEVSWSAPQRDANRFDVYRRDTLANNFLRINSVAVEAGLDGRVRVVDLISPFQADKYRIVALTRDDELASGGLLDVDVGACGRVLGESHRPSQVLLVLGLVAAALVSVSVRRRRSPVPR